MEKGDWVINGREEERWEVKVDDGKMNGEDKGKMLRMKGGMNEVEAWRMKGG